MNYIDLYSWLVPGTTIVEYQSGNAAKITTSENCEKCRVEFTTGEVISLYPAEMIKRFRPALKRTRHSLPYLAIMSEIPDCEIKPPSARKFYAVDPKIEKARKQEYCAHDWSFGRMSDDPIICKHCGIDKKDLDIKPNYKTSGFDQMDKYLYSILDICSILHGEHSGSGSSVFSIEQHKHYIAWLEWRINSCWDESKQLTKIYDNAVLNLAKMCLAEIKYGVAL